MRRGLVIFAYGFVAGIAAAFFVGVLHPVSSERTGDSLAVIAQTHPPRPSPPERPPRSESPANATAPVDQGPPTMPLQVNATNVADVAQTILIQHLHPRLQAALKQYSSLGSTDARSALADDVANLVDDDVPIREVVEALGVMFHREPSTEVRIDILNNLLNLDDPSSYQLLVLGVDPNQPQEVRKAAISVLGDYDDTWAVPTLQQLLADGDAEIRQAAQEALTQKTDHTTSLIPPLR
jgi:hypothetical protein